MRCHVALVVADTFGKGLHVRFQWGCRCFLLLLLRSGRGAHAHLLDQQIFLLNLLIGFLSPAIDPEAGEDGGPLLPTSNEEFRPFSRRLPEMKMWHSSMRAIVASLFMTLFGFFDVPVFWPILLIVRWPLVHGRACAELTRTHRCCGGGGGAGGGGDKNSISLFCLFSPCAGRLHTWSSTATCRSTLAARRRTRKRRR